MNLLKRIDRTLSVLGILFFAIGSALHQSSLILSKNENIKEYVLQILYVSSNISYLIGFLLNRKEIITKYDNEHTIPSQMPTYILPEFDNTTLPEFNNVPLYEPTVIMPSGQHPHVQFHPRTTTDVIEV